MMIKIVNVISILFGILGLLACSVNKIPQIEIGNSSLSALLENYLNEIFAKQSFYDDSDLVFLCELKRDTVNLTYCPKSVLNGYLSEYNFNLLGTCEDQNKNSYFLFFGFKLVKGQYLKGKRKLYFLDIQKIKYLTKKRLKTFYPPTSIHWQISQYVIKQGNYIKIDEGIHIQFLKISNDYKIPKKL